jgi:hypothetical protein
MRENLLELSRIFATAVGAKSRSGDLSFGALSTRMMNDGKSLDRIARGGDLTTGSYEDCILWLNDNWPPEAIWPEHIPRPANRRKLVETDAA